HRIAEEWHLLDPINTEWQVVEADAEGWIKWDGGECPLPDDAPLEYTIRDGDEFNTTRAGNLRWEYGYGFPEADIIAYRPILDKPTVEDSLTSDVDGLLSGLTAAHEAAQKIPDLEA